MTRDTKRVDELEVGDIIIIPGGKGTFTVSHIEKVGFREYRIICQGIRQAFFYYDNVEVPYLGNNNKEETMTTPKVDCSILYPYLDALVDREPELHILDLPSYLKKELRNIYELFEGVLELTLEEVKTLYFERKMSKEESEIEEITESKHKTKKVKDLCINDKIFLFLPYEDYEGEETITKLQEFSDTQIRIITEQGTEAILKKDKVVSLIG